MPRASSDSLRLHGIVTCVDCLVSEYGVDVSVPECEEPEKVYVDLRSKRVYKKTAAYRLAGNYEEQLCTLRDEASVAAWLEPLRKPTGEQWTYHQALLEYWRANRVHPPPLPRKQQRTQSPGVVSGGTATEPPPPPPDDAHMEQVSAPVYSVHQGPHAGAGRPPEEGDEDSHSNSSDGCPVYGVSYIPGSPGTAVCDGGREDTGGVADGDSGAGPPQHAPQLAPGDTAYDDVGAGSPRLRRFDGAEDPIDTEDEGSASDTDVAAGSGADVQGVEPDFHKALWSAGAAEVCSFTTAQAVRLVTEYQRRHALSNEALSDLLYMLEALLPDSHHMPPTLHMLRKAVRQALWTPSVPCTSRLDRDQLFTAHMCSSEKCDHIYSNYPGGHDEECPKAGCGARRFKVAPNGKIRGARKVRYCGLANGLRVLLLREGWCRAKARFDVPAARDYPASVLSSTLAASFCQRYIPRYADMAPDEREKAAVHFLSTGQVCAPEQMEGRMRTMMLLVEHGADAFQPFKRRGHSTWVLAFRVLNTAQDFAATSAAVFVQALMDGPKEGSTFDDVLRPTVRELKELAPPSALLAASQEYHEAPLVASTWRVGEGGVLQGLETVGVFVLWTGAMADLPMRCKIYKNLHWSALNACDACGIVGSKAVKGAVKFTGYREPCVGRVWNGVAFETVKAFANGTVVAAAPRQASTCLTPDIMARRDCEVARRCAAFEDEAEKGRQGAASKGAHQMFMEMGSTGKPVFQELEYYDGILHQPIAPYHTLWLGPIKDYLGWVAQRLASTGELRGDPLPGAFKHPSWLGSVIAARMRHVVLRSVTGCTLVDFTQNLKSMTIAEVQLMVEVALPYLMLDWVTFGVPEEVVLIGLLLRFSAMKLTRVHGTPSRAEYEQAIRDARAAAFAAMALLQGIHGEQVKSMPATMKAHLITHLAEQALQRCHACASSDLWVERMLRTYGTAVVKNRVSANAEATIWNAHVQDMGRTMLDAEIAARCAAHGSQNSDVPVAPTLDDIVTFAKGRQARRSMGLSPWGGAWGTATRGSARSITSLKARDTNVPSGQTAMLGLGRRVDGKCTRGNEIALAVGFFLYTNCRANVTPGGEKAYTWPPADSMAGVRAGTIRTGYPDDWSACPPDVMATVYRFETYPRASLCASEPLSSEDYGRLRAKDDSWLWFLAYTDRNRAEARKCVGQVQYFVKCTPRETEEPCRAAAHAYGLPFTEPQRFALCHVWHTEDAGYRRTSRFQSPGMGFRALCKCLKQSRTCQTPADVEVLLEKVEKDAALLRIKGSTDKRVKLENCSSRVILGGIKVIAVPLNAEWKGTEWEATPMVSINPKNSLGALNPMADAKRCPTDTIGNAIVRNGRSYRYFALSHTQSGL